MFTTTKKKFADFNIMSAGLHKATIVAFAETKPKLAPWSDVTKQTVVTFENAEGAKISMWNNFIGYRNKTDFPDGKAPKGHAFMSSEGHNENYLVNTGTKARVVSDERTADAVRIFLEFLEESGVAKEGDEFESIDEIIAFATENLLDVQMGVKVRINDDNKSEVHHTMSLANVEAKLLASVEADA